ncbi:hypothetical protein JTB14_013251 [Gonioctena quinquepunctata]|nr:hypothetical protein JTB14_013251 [Gonioctena quinquepunctata]
MSTEDKEKAVSDVRDVSSAENDCLPSDSAGSNENVMESHAHRYESILPSPVVSDKFLIVAMDDLMIFHNDDEMRDDLKRKLFRNFR